MMATELKGVLVARIGGQWHFTAPPTGEQQQFVRARATEPRWAAEDPALDSRPGRSRRAGRRGRS